MSQFSGLYISISGMAANKAAMETAAHNMANVTTPGYTRQQIMLSSNNPYQSANFNGQVGSGVKVDGIRRMTDSYLEGRIQREQASADNWSNQSGLMNKIESNIASLNIPEVFNNFWNAWHGASLNTEQENGRFEVQEQAEGLIYTLKSASNQMEEIDQEIDDNISDQMKMVSNLGEQIAMLNKEISQSIAKGQQPNDLMDKRITVLREFVGITGASVVYNKDDTVSITLTAKPSPTAEAEEIKIVDGIQFNDLPENADLVVTNGSLYGLINVRDNELRSNKEYLDQIAKDLATEVNALHSVGYTVNGDTGINFFTDPVTGVKDLDLSTEVKANKNNIAVNGSTPEETGTSALNIYNLGTGITKEISNFIEEIGASAKSADFQNTSHQDIINEMDNMRAEISGISIDEELANVMQFQRAYEASAKVLSIMDSLLESLINMVR